MKIDLDFARELLRKVEAGSGIHTDLNIEDKKEVFHALILEDAGYLKRRRTIVSTSNRAEVWDEMLDDPNYGGHRLTFEGSEFLSAAWDDARWEKGKEELEESKSPWSMDTLFKILSRLAWIAAGLDLG